MIAGVLDGRIGIDARELEAAAESEGRPEPEGSRFVGNWRNAKGDRRDFRATEDGVALLPVHGSLVNRGAHLGASSGLTSYEGLKHQLAAAASDATIRAVVLDMNSPGGQAVGAFEAADAVRAVAAVKPVVALVDGMAASAAYAIASAATRIVTLPTGLSGSIGVVMLHADFSRKLDREGITPTLIHAGARKVDGHPYAPLSGPVRADLQAEIDRFYDLFVETVATGRKGLTPEAIRATEARCFMGADAVRLGLADAVGTFESALAELSRAPSGRAHPAGRPASTRGPSMSDKIYSQADLDKAAADARTAGHTAGKAEGEAGKAEAVAAARTEAGKAAQDRFTAILGCDQARGRQAQALVLAATSDITLDAAKAVLDASPKATSLGQRAGAGGSELGPDGSAKPGEADAAVSWNSIVDGLNASLKGGRA